MRGSCLITRLDSEPRYGPGGAYLQVLKLEIGGDAASSDGAEPSVEHSQGQIDCKSGYSWWLAEHAVARDPAIKLAALQWSCPATCYSPPRPVRPA